MEKGHTPGPWTWRVGKPGQDYGYPIGGIVGSNDALVCDFGDGTQYYPSEGAPPNDADRVLMLAAPELLKMVRELIAPVPNGESWNACLVRREHEARALLARIDGAAV